MRGYRGVKYTLFTFCYCFWVSLTVQEVQTVLNVQRCFTPGPTVHGSTPMVLVVCRW